MVEVPQPPVTVSWQKSSASGNANDGCVQISCTQEQVWIRDSKNPDGPVLGFSRSEWAAFLAGVQCDELAHPVISA